MNWLYNLSIKTKILILVAFMLTSTSIVSLLSYKALTTDLLIVNSLYNDRILPLRDLKVIADMYAVNVVDTTHKVRNANISWQEARKNLQEAKKTINEKWNAYLATVLVEEEERLIAEVKPLMKKANEAVENLEVIFKTENMDALTSFSINTLYPVIDPVSDKFSQLIDVQTIVAGQDYESMVLASKNSNYTNALAWLVSLVLGLSLGLLIANRIGKNAAQLSQLSSRIANTQEFSLRSVIDDKDEVGDISRAFNQLLARLEAAIAESNSTVSAIASGDFSQRITGNYLGDLAKLKDGVNASADNISLVMNALSDSLTALKQGAFSHRVSAKAQGKYGEMLVSASDTMNSLNTVVANLNSVMGKMSAGDFSGRVTADAQGDLLEMKNQVNQSMTQIETAMGHIVRIIKAQSEGDLTQTCSQSFQGELEATKQALNATNERLKQVITQVIMASNVVSDAAGQVSQGSSDLSARVQQQAAALEEASATMNQMTSAVQANTDSANKVAVLAQKVQGQSNDGVAVMQQTIEAMKSIQQSSDKIADIVTIIDSIAFQTNLLALNAAVEAARAGEHGRGFAVVASEVRALAGKSADAAKDIKGLIEDSVNRIHNGTQLAEKSGEVLNSIAGSIGEVSQMIGEIANANKEQSIGINQVHLAIADIDRMTQENAALVEETTAAAESLNHEANGLRENMAFFKTGQQQPQASANQRMHPASGSVAKPTVNNRVALPAPKKAKSEEWGEF